MSPTQRGHVLVVHSDCEETSCPICIGGLFQCAICGGAEGSLPTECPGEMMEPTREQDVYEGLIDFRDGAWIPLITSATPREVRQREVIAWGRRCFGDKIVSNRQERVARFLEEAIELAQSLELPEEMAHKLVTHIFARPVGTPTQEVGGVGVTLLVLCESLGISADAQEVQEMNRILKLPPSHFAARQNAKANAGVAASVPSPVEELHHTYKALVDKHGACNCNDGWFDCLLAGHGGEEMRAKAKAIAEAAGSTEALQRELAAA